MVSHRLDGWVCVHVGMYLCMYVYERVYVYLYVYVCVCVMSKIRHLEMQSFKMRYCKPYG